MLLAAALTAVIVAVIELLVLRRVYMAPELFQLLATFAVALIVRDAVLWLWGPEDLLGPKAPGMKGAVEVLGARFPVYGPVPRRWSVRWCSGRLAAAHTAPASAS